MTPPYADAWPWPVPLAFFFYLAMYLATFIALLERTSEIIMLPSLFDYLPFLPFLSKMSLPGEGYQSGFIMVRLTPPTISFSWPPDKEEDGRRSLWAIETAIGPRENKYSFSMTQRERIPFLYGRDWADGTQDFSIPFFCECVGLFSFCFLPIGLFILWLSRPRYKRGDAH